MPNTTTQNYPYPSLTDTPNAPSQLQDLAQAIDDSVTSLQTATANLVPPLYDFTDTDTELPDAPYDGYVIRALVQTKTVWLLGWSEDDSVWNYLGGPGMVDVVSTSETRTTNTYAGLATAGPTLTIPTGFTTGVYELRLEADIAGSTGDGNSYYSYKVNSGSASDGVAIQQNNQSFAHVSGGKRPTFSGGDVLLAQYKGNNATASTFADRRMHLTPVYITP